MSTMEMKQAPNEYTRLLDDGDHGGVVGAAARGGGAGAPTAVTSHMRMMERNAVDESHVRGDFSLEDSPSYEILNQHQLLTKKYRVQNESDLDLMAPNSTRIKNAMTCLFCCPLVCCGCVKNFEVENGRLKQGYDGRGNYMFFGPGVHQVLDPWYTVHHESISYARENVVHGDRSIITVHQGFVGFCTERGQPVLLPPGLHQWQSSTLVFQRLIDLNESVIQIGPWTLLTIDQGYKAVTQDNGRQVILDGGSVYLLTHRNWKFEKFISTKIQTDELARHEAASADNVIMLVDATVLWRIADVETAVRMSAETMAADGTKKKSDIVKLRNDVLKQAEASLAFFIGTINFSDSMAAAAVHQRTRDSYNAGAALAPSATAQRVVTGNTEALANDAAATSTTTPVAVEVNMYNNDRLRDAVAHANEITHTYGVEIISINIISAIPKDKNLQASLAKGAVAAAEAQMMETAAHGKSRAMQIEATATAKQTMIVAQAEADAEIVRAEGSKQAADLLSTNAVSVDLAKIDRTGQALAGNGNHASFFFGLENQQRALGSLLANSSVVGGGNHNGSSS